MNDPTKNPYAPAWILSPAPEGTPRCGARDKASGTSNCVLAAGHVDPVHQDQHTNQWPALKGEAS